MACTPKLILSVLYCQGLSLALSTVVIKRVITIVGPIHKPLFRQQVTVQNIQLKESIQRTNNSYNVQLTVDMKLCLLL